MFLETQKQNGALIFCTRKVSTVQSATFLNFQAQITKLDGEVPIILSNVYLPSSSCPEAEYDAELARLSAALDTLSADGAIILSGDFNRSLFRTNQSDRKFQKFCDTQGLTPAQGTTDVPTYHGYNNTASRIDYVLLHTDSCTTFGLKLSDIRILEHICKDDNEHICQHMMLCYLE